MTQFNNFIEGLETDMSPDLVKPSKYIDGENFRIIAGDSDGLIINNGKGPKRLLKSNTHKIVGIVNINYIVVIFFKANLDNDYNYIYKINLVWLLSFNEKLIDLARYFSDPPVDVKQGTMILRSKKLKFGEQISCVYNIENEKLYQLYFTSSDIPDSPIYRINVLKNYGTNPDLNEILLFNNTILKTPEILGIEDGNLKCGTYRYAYQVFELNGSETVYSGLTRPVFLTSSSYSSTYSNFSGNLSTDDTSNKSIKLKISGIKDKYCRIVRLYYKDIINFPICYIVFEGKIKSNDFIFTDASFNNVVGTSSIDDISLPFVPIKAKHLETKNNFLFFGNVTEEYFDVDINTRAYRWDLGNSVIKLIDLNNNLVTISRNTYEAYGSTIQFYNDYEDCCSAFNMPMSNNYSPYSIHNWNTSSSPLESIGGHGYHVEYKFILKKFRIANSINYTYSTGGIFLDNTFSLPSPLTTEIGYQRDEIYRFGVIFFNDKGQRTPVKWIEDIRFPRNGYPFYLTEIVNNDQSQPTYANIIGIHFKFKFLPKEIKALQVVRALRTKENGTIIDAGILSTHAKSSTGYYYLRNGGYWNSFNEEFSSRDIGLIYKIGSDPLFDYISPELKYSNEYKNLGSHIAINSDMYVKGKQVYLCTRYESDEESSYGPVVIHLRQPSTYNYSENYSEITYKHFYESSRTLNKSISLPGNIYMRPRTGEEDKRHKEYRRGYRYSSLLLKLKNPINSATKYPKYAYRKQNIYPYGGYSKSAKENTKYIPCSDIIKVYNGYAETDVFQGDTFIGIFEYMYATADANIDDNSRQPILVQAIVESRVNLWYTSDNKISKKFPNQIYYDTKKMIEPFDTHPDLFGVWTTQEESGVYDINTDKTKKYVQGSNLYEYNGVYSAVDPKVYYYQKSSLQSNIVSYPVRITKSPKKFNNALSDTWSRVNPSDCLDLEIQYGDLTSLISSTSGLITFQNKGIAIIPVEERTLIKDTSQNELITGKSKALDRFDYINTIYGVVDYKHVQKTPNAIYFIDTNNKIIGRITDKVEVLSKMKGVQNLLNEMVLDPYYANIVFNSKYNEIWFCLGNKTLLFSEINNMFVSKLDTYFTNDINVYNTSLGIINNNNYSNLYVLDRGNYGKYKIDNDGSIKSSIFSLEFVVNPNNGTLNRIDSILVNGIADSNKELFNTLQVKNNYQNTGEMVVHPELRFRSWKINYIRDLNENRLIDYYNIVKLKYIPLDFSESYKILIKGIFSENIPIFNR